MSFQIVITCQHMPGAGVVLLAQSVRPGVMDTRQDDEIRHALLEQATVQAKQMIDQEMIGGDSTEAAAPLPNFLRAVHVLAEYGMLEPDVELELEDDGHDVGWNTAGDGDDDA